MVATATSPASATSPTPSTGDRPPPTGGRPRPAWALPAMIAGILAIVVASVAGVRGLEGNPVVSTDGRGVAVLRGSFQPFPCPAQAPGCVQGYVQEGARSVFVRLADGCPTPYREQRITVTGATLDRTLGTDSFRSPECAGPG